MFGGLQLRCHKRIFSLFQFALILYFKYMEIDQQCCDSYRELFLILTRIYFKMKENLEGSGSFLLIANLCGIS